jgi:hypothetical protein
VEEFTNGTSLTLAYRRSRVIVDVMPTETQCPYCGWAYDQPDRAVPEHATCQHLIASAFWRGDDPAQDAVAVVTPSGSWRCWSQGDAAAYRKNLEKTLGRLSVKVESATAAVVDVRFASTITCRYYFARRSEQATAELSAIANDCCKQVETPIALSFIRTLPDQYAPAAMR